MTLGKMTEDAMLLVEVEAGKEVGGNRTEAELRADGYEDVCLTDKPSDDAVCSYERITNGWIQIWTIPDPEPEPTE